MSKLSNLFSINKRYTRVAPKMVLTDVSIPGDATSMIFYDWITEATTTTDEPEFLRRPSNQAGNVFVG